MRPHPPNLKIVDHPLIQHMLSRLRGRATGHTEFRALTAELSTLVAFKATEDLSLHDVEIETPLEPMTGKQLAAPSPALIPILRAGLGMVDGIARLIPTAPVGHIGMYRDHDTLDPVPYYLNIPPEPATRLHLVLDPMLATGGSAIHAVKALHEAGAKAVRVLCLVAAPEGVRRFSEAHPNVPIFSAALDRELNDNGYILPGLGDAGDRLFGTI